MGNYSVVLVGRVFPFRIISHGAPRCELNHVTTPDYRAPWKLHCLLVPVTYSVVFKWKGVRAE